MEERTIKDINNLLTQLFQKMYEAGYEWDAERKELCTLSKSEATSDSVTSPLVDAAKAFLQALSDTPYNNTPVVEAQIITKQLLTFLSDPKAYNPNAINEHKSAEWSEEDEKQARQIERIVHYDGCSKKLQKQISDWLKSIKDRVGCEADCTTTKEWSEEDEDAIGMAIIALDDMYDPDEPNTTYAGYSMPFNKAAERLKSLRDRIK